MAMNTVLRACVAISLLIGSAAWAQGRTNAFASKALGIYVPFNAYVHRAMASEEGRAWQATQVSAPLMMGPKELGGFQLREYNRFKRVAELAGIKRE